MGNLRTPISVINYAFNKSEAIINSFKKGIMESNVTDIRKLGPDEATTLVAHYADENKKLRAFAKDIMEAWPDGCIEGDDLQEIAVKHGMLAPEIRHEPCGEWCQCNSMNCLDSDDWKGGVE